MKVRVAGSDISEVALEMLLVHRIETDNGGVQSDVLLGHAVAKVEWTTFLLLEMGLGTVQ